MRLLFHFVVIGVVMIVVGCSTDEHTATLIRHAENIVVENPDLALTVMRGVDARTVRGKHDKAHYQLVYSEALYYNRIKSFVYIGKCVDRPSMLDYWNKELERGLYYPEWQEGIHID